MRKILSILCTTIIFISCNEKLETEKEYTVKNKIIEEERTEEILMPIKIGEKKDFNVNEKELETYIINLK